MVTVTDKAIGKVKELLVAENKQGYGLRVEVRGGGCSGLKYGLTFESGSDPGDQILELDGVKVFIDPKSNLYLQGASIDYVDGLEGAGFKIDNPNATASCSCGDSFSA